MRLIGLAVLLAVSLTLAPLAANAQQAGKVYRIGWLSPGPTTGPDTFLETFRQGLREHGWSEGRDVAIEYRGADRKPERFPDLAVELVRAKVDVIVTAGGPPTLEAARRATTTIPIVMLAASVDPIGQGLIVSFARPGGNVTGLVSGPEGLSGKRLQLLREAVPRLSRVGVLWDTSTGPYRLLKETEDAARSLNLDLLPFEVRGPDDLPGAFRDAVSKRVGAISIASTPLVFQQRKRLADLAVEHRLPTISQWRYFAESGGLLTYGPSLPEQFRRAAYFVDRILRGTKPADLPVEQAMKFELVINLKTARALGLTIPQTILLQADQVIQ